MTVDNVLSYVRYNGADVSVTGNLASWYQEKTFSINIVAGAELEIAGYENRRCNGCRCSGLLMECDNGLVSNLNDWVVAGSSSQNISQSPEYNKPCKSSSGFSLPGTSTKPVKIWASNGEKYAWFKMIPQGKGRTLHIR